MKYNPKVIYKIKKYFLKKEKLIEQELKHSPLLIYWGSDSVEKKKKMLVFSHQSKKWGKRLLILTLASALIFSIFKIYSSGLRPARAADVLIKFDEGYGGSANDTNSTVSAGTITNAVWRTEDLCKSGKCLYFDGSGDKVAYSDDADLDFVAADDFTITGWFRHPVIATNPDYLVTKHESGTAGGYKVYMDSDGDLVFGVDDDGTWDTANIVGDDQSKNFDDNRWHHFAAQKDGTTGIYLYVDGHLIDSDTDLTGDTGTLANAASFYIGIDADGSSNAWDGFIDEIKVYRSLRTAAEIKADFAGSTPDRGTAASFGPDFSFLSDGLVGYWKMDESDWTNDCTTTSVTDSSGNGNNGKSCPSTTGPDPSSGKFGNSGDFDVSDDYVEIPNSTSLQDVQESNYSINAWFKPDTTPADAPHDYFVVAKKGNHTGLRYSYQNKIVANVMNTSNQSFAASSANTYSTGQWIHASYTVDTNSKKVTLYVNGAYAGEVTYTGTLREYGTEPFRIGIAWNTTCTTNWANCFDGKIDEARIYNRALSPAEVSRLYNLGSGLLGWWKMDEGSANTCTGGANDSCDSSGNGYDGAWNGNAISTNGKFGNGVIFDGTGDYIDAGDIGL